MAATGKMDGPAVLDACFLEMRGKLLEVAATLDRVDRAGGAPGDERLTFIDQALTLLREGQTQDMGRAERLLRLYSKP